MTATLPSATAQGLRRSTIITHVSFQQDSLQRIYYFKKGLNHMYDLVLKNFS